MRRWFEDAVGGLKWRPKDFWKATPGEFLGAIAGHNRANSAGGGKPPPLSVEEQDELLAWDRERKLKKNG